MAKVVIFGVLDTAELAHYYLTNDSPHEVAGFAVDGQYMPQKPTFKDLPVVPFETVEKTFPVDQYSFFAPMFCKQMNIPRAKKYEEIKTKGYNFINYVSSHATILTDKIGENCFILEDNTVQPYTKIGNNVVLWSGNHIGHHSEIGDHVFCTSHVVVSGHCKVEPYCFLGVNSTIRNNTRVAEGTLVAMASAITGDTNPWKVYDGNPAKERNIDSRKMRL